MSTDNKDVPLFVLAQPYEGTPMKDKEGNPIRVRTLHVQGCSLEYVKQEYFREYERELDDENAEILQRGGMLKIVFDD